MTNKSDGSTAEYTGGKVNYYEVEITHPTREGRDPYIAECNDIIEALGLSFSEGEAFKAIWRKGAARIKPGKRGHDGGLYDAEKASFYGQRMETIERFNIGKPATHSTVKQSLTVEPASRAKGGPIPADATYIVGEQPSEQFAVEPASLIDDESPRMQAIGQNGPSAEHYAELEHLRTAADFADDVPVSVDEAIELGAKPIGDCKACQTFAMACTGACEGVPDCDCDRYQPGKVIPCNGECERQ